MHKKEETFKMSLIIERFHRNVLLTIEWPMIYLLPNLPSLGKDIQHFILRNLILMGSNSTVTNS